MGESRPKPLMSALGGKRTLEQPWPQTERGPLGVVNFCADESQQSARKHVNCQTRAAHEQQSGAAPSYPPRRTAVDERLFVAHFASSRSVHHMLVSRLTASVADLATSLARRAHILLLRTVESALGGKRTLSDQCKHRSL